MKLDTKKIKFLMLENNLTKNQLSRKTGITRQWLSKNLDRGYSTNDLIHRIAKGLNVEVEDIVILDD